MKKKLVSVLLATGMVFSLVACNSGTPATSEVASNGAPEDRKRLLLKPANMILPAFQW